MNVLRQQCLFRSSVKLRKITSCAQKRYVSEANFQGRSSFIRYIRGLKWTPIPLGLGFAYLCYQQYGEIKKREKRKLEGNISCKETATDTEISLIKFLPLRELSIVAGWFAEKELPVWIREKFFSWYIKKYNCDMDEALESDPLKYNSFQSFFRRQLKPEVRKVDEAASIVSPSDGTILYFGEVKDQSVEQVKGIFYSLEEFLGPVTWKDKDKENKYTDQLLSNKDNILYHCVIYLNPGNYHRFHSPAEWSVYFRRHFSGELLSTMPSFVNWIKGLYCINERVACIGKWKHGFFAMVPVGATNVGSIHLNFDEDLKTNKFNPKNNFEDCDYRNPANQVGVHMAKGQPFGEFKLGSTIVLIFEGPKNLKSNVMLNENLKYGQALYSS